MTPGTPRRRVSCPLALAIISTVGISTVGISTVGISTVGISTVGISTVGLSTVGISTVGLSSVGLSSVGLSSVGLSLAATALADERPRAGDKEGNKKERRVTVGLVNDQILVGSFIDKSLTVRTKYGVLTVPVSEVVRIRFRPTLGAEKITELDRLIGEMASGEDESEEKGLARIRELGIPAYHRIAEAREKAEETLGDRLESLLEEIRSVTDVYTEGLDEIVTERFTIKGHIVESSFRFDCVSITLEVPRSDMVHVTFRELELKKTWKVGLQHMEARGFIDTGVELRKNQKISLTASGTMSYNGRSFGPAGLSNHTWNGRKLGCLQWRLGSGAWKILGTSFNGKVEQKGTLQLSVHLYNTNGSGEFKVTLKTRKKV